MRPGFNAFREEGSIQNSQRKALGILHELVQLEVRHQIASVFIGFSQKILGNIIATQHAVPSISVSAHPLHILTP